MRRHGATERAGREANRARGVPGLVALRPEVCDGLQAYL